MFPYTTENDERISEGGRAVVTHPEMFTERARTVFGSMLGAPVNGLFLSVAITVDGFDPASFYTLIAVPSTPAP